MALKEDIEIKVEACDRGMNQIKNRMISLIPQERDTQREALTQKLEKLKKDEDSLFRDFFSLCAQAIVLREKIMGSDLRRNRMGDMLENNPRLDIQAFSSGMNTEDSVFLCNEVKRLRAASPARGQKPIQRQRENIEDEIEKINSPLDDESLNSEVKKIIDSYR